MRVYFKSFKAIGLEPAILWDFEDGLYTLCLFRASSFKTKSCAEGKKKKVKKIYARSLGIEPGPLAPKPAHRLTVPFSWSERAWQLTMVSLVDNLHDVTSS